VRESKKRERGRADLREERGREEGGKWDWRGGKREGEGRREEAGRRLAGKREG
jgi:hypothetical protein